MRTKETALYEPVRIWFEKLLKGKYRRSQVKAYDSHRISLGKLIEKLALQKCFPQFSAWDIKVDITAVILGKNSARLAFVECKTAPITLRDVGQLLGYSIVANPAVSLLISPKGVSAPLMTLMKVFGVYAILEFGPQRRRIRIVRWDPAKRDIVYAQTLPPGENI